MVHRIDRRDALNRTRSVSEARLAHSVKGSTAAQAATNLSKKARKVMHMPNRKNMHRDLEELPLAYFLTLRTYGTWLHGDERGSVDAKHNCYNTPYTAPDRGSNVRNKTEPVASARPVSSSPTSEGASRKRPQIIRQGRSSICRLRGVPFSFEACTPASLTLRVL